MATTQREILHETSVGAMLDVTRRYRYQLWRSWDESRPRAVFILLNPSTADEQIDDRTVLKCVRFAKRWGCGSAWLCNVFAWRAPHPDELLQVADPVGPENDDWIVRTATPDGGPLPVVVCGWGPTVEQLGRRDRHVLELLRAAGVTPHYLRLTKGGHPEHPLYLRESLTPRPLNEGIS